MKFNWGTGIFLFLVLFLAGAAVFIVFAARQQVNLVHEDYYEEGADYSEQMKMDARSKVYAHSVSTQSNDKFFIVNIEKDLATKIDSGILHLYRPSDKTKDMITNLKAGSVESFSPRYEFDKRALLNGRYILKFSWYTDGVRYQIEKPVSVQ